MIFLKIFLSFNFLKLFNRLDEETNSNVSADAISFEIIRTCHDIVNMSMNKIMQNVYIILDFKHFRDGFKKYDF